MPPYERFISLILTSKNNKKLDQDSDKLKKFLVKKINGKILGPVNAPLYRLKNNYRNRLLIRSNKSVKIQRSLAQAIKNFNLSSEIKLTVDVDPINFN